MALQPKRLFRWMLPPALAAAAGPACLAFNVSPSATFLNQALAVALWGLWAAALGWRVMLDDTQRARASRAMAMPALVLGALAMATLGHLILGSLPATFAHAHLAMLAAAALLLFSGAHVGAAPRASRHAVWWALCWALLGAGLINAAIAATQVFWPELADGQWLARSSLPGRAVGNLRQPNHVATLILWAMVAATVLTEARQWRLRLAWPAQAVLAGALVLTASRTGLLGVALLALWGLLDRRLSRPSRALLMALPVLYAAAWAAMAAWTQGHGTQFLAAERWAAADLSASRFRIWADSWRLVMSQPWLGVGVGEFNHAWSLSVLPERPVAFFDHAHNLSLHWAVELGLPLAIGLTLALLWALWRVARAAFAQRPWRETLPTRASFVLLLLVGVHSQLEYPLWYAYFLLPTAWLLGFGLAQAASPPRVAPQRLMPDGTRTRPGGESRPMAALALAGSVLALGAALAVADYARVAVIFDAQSQRSLAERIRDGQRSFFFGHHADYAAATTRMLAPDDLRIFRRPTHHLLDTRLMIAWAEALAAAGDLPRARYLAARLREFRNPASKEWFDRCPPAAASAPSQDPACLGPDPNVVLNWTNFR
jgi:O-antigen ligase